MSGHFTKIGLFAKHNNNSVIDTLEKLIRFLKKRGHSLTIESQSAALIPNLPLPALERETLGKHCDLVIVIGGDGSLLNAARAVVKDEVPILGINRGRLGFLADILPRDMEQTLTPILDGRYQEERRFLLQANVHRAQKIVFEATALNDVVLYSGYVARMIDFEVSIDNLFVLRQQADGIIAATPTGSTAYALSAGGPILYPTLNAIALSPLCPHTLSSRPLVIDNQSEIKWHFTEENSGDAKLSCDGQLHFDLKPGDQIAIQKYPIELTLIHPKDHQYFAVLREKLGWSMHQYKE